MSISPSKSFTPSVEADRLKELLDYVEQVVRLDERPAFRLDEYKLRTGQTYIFHQNAFHALPGISHDLADDDGPLWLSVQRLDRGKPPPHPESLGEWIQISPDPERQPRLEESIIHIVSAEEARTLVREGKARAEDCAPSLKHSPPHRVDVRFRAEDKPDLREAFETYLAESWLPWAEAERPRRKTITLYQRLFELSQYSELVGAEQPIEIVWGIGLSRWSVEERLIDLPLIERLVEIEIADSANGEIRIRPRVAPASVNLRPYEELQIDGLALALDAANRALVAAQQDEDGLTPFVRESFEPVLRACQTRLDPEGVYLPDQESLAATASMPMATPHLTVSDRWVIFARPRSDNFLLNDLRNLKDAVDRSEGAIPSPARTLVMGPDKDGGAGWGPLGNTIGQSIEVTVPEVLTSPLGDLFFPKPFNDEQIEIIRRLENHDGMVVQGPPGTGKTHTISNIICHYLATGRRVLVVSHGEPALAVLRDQLPQEIRELAISVTSSEREGFRQIEAAVRLLQSVVQQIRPSEQKRLIEDTERSIIEMRRQLANLDAELTDLANRQLEAVPGSSLRPAELAAAAVEVGDRYAWFDDLPTLFHAQAAFSGEDIARLRQARVAVGAHIDATDAVLPSINDLPDGQAVERLHNDLLQAEEFRQRAASNPNVATRIRSGGELGLAHQILAHLESLLAIHADAVEHPWLLRSAELPSNHPLRALLAEFVTEVKQSLDQQARFLQRPVDYPPGFTVTPQMADLIGRLAAGQQAFGLFAFKERALRPVLEGIRIAAQAPRSSADWAHIQAHIHWKARLDGLCRRWTSLAEEIGAPVTVATAADLAWLVRKIVSALEVMPAAAAGLRQHLHIVTVGVDASTLAREPDSCRALQQQLRAAVAVANLSASKAELERSLALFSDKSAKVGVLARQFLTEIVGSQQVEKSRISRTWDMIRARIDTHTRLKASFVIIQEITQRIHDGGAPNWAARLRTRPVESSREDPFIPDDWSAAWDWAAALGFLQRIDKRQRLKEIGEERLKRDKAIEGAFERLVRDRTFFSLGTSLRGPVRAALMMFATAIRQIGRGTGRGAVRHRRAAREAMAKCYDAVPCWIMPSWRVSEQLPPALGAFDLVIMDEASQSDIKEVTALLRGKKVLIVGDDKQVSPSAAFIENSKLDRLERTFLKHQPFKTLLLPGASLYDLAKVMFPDKFVMLREHFRCVEPIIRFSMQFYPMLVPLRIPSASERLDPPLIDIFVPDGRRTGNKINQREAEVIVDEIRNIVETPSRAKIAGTDRYRSIGVVSLIGAKQAALVNRMLLEAVGEEAFLHHRIACGDSATFQGNERDIIFLSLNADPSRRSAQTAVSFEQRFNVALSRARDRIVLVRSVQEDQLNPNDLKARVIRHFHDPMAGAETPSGDLEEKCDSDFERNVLRRLIKRGYRVRPQVGALGFRIDLVVEGENDKRLAIELDGDKYHGPERWADDMRRQRVLERVGWRFWRCWASSFTLDPEACMADLLATLERAGIQPIGTDSVGSKYTEHRIAVPSQPEPVRYDVEETGGIGVGDRLTIRYLDTNKTATFRLTQERTDELNGLLGVTSPLGAQVLGAQADDELEFDAGDVKRTVLIVAVEPHRTRESPAQEEALVDA